jgi:hypothetical protein
VSRLALLDLYCCQGGATRGYQLGGFEVTGVDIVEQPRYIGDQFIQADVVSFLYERADWIRKTFQVIHASPPCQHDSPLTAGTNADRPAQHPDLLLPTVAALDHIGLPWILEQPPGKATKRMPRPPDLKLCGETFGLGVTRHRNFWLSRLSIPQIVHKPHRGRTRGWRHGVYYEGPYLAVYGRGGGKGSVSEWQQAMGIDWTDDRKAIAEAIPPAYSQFIAESIVRDLN